MAGKVIQGSFLSGQPKFAASIQPRIAASPPPIQPKTATRPPGPPAAAVAGRPPGPPVPAFAARVPGPPPTAFGHRPAAVQRHGAGAAFAVEAGQLGLASWGGGRPLPEAVRGKMEAALGADFSNVRVHVGPQAERIGAIAFTLGSDIYFAPGRFQPDTVHGQQLLGHELAHVVQQRIGRVKNPLGSGLAVVQDHALEAEADRLGRHAAAHRIAAQVGMPSAAQPYSPLRISPRAAKVGSVMVHATPRGPYGPPVVQRMLWQSSYTQGAGWGGRWVSTFDTNTVIDVNNAAITVAATEDTFTGGHAEVYLEFIDQNNNPQEIMLDMIGGNNDRAILRRYNKQPGDISNRGAWWTRGQDTTREYHKGGGSRTYSIPVAQVQPALGAFDQMNNRATSGELKYTYWFPKLKNAVSTEQVVVNGLPMPVTYMNCADFAEYILAAAGVTGVTSSLISRPKYAATASLF